MDERQDSIYEFQKYTTILFQWHDETSGFVRVLVHFYNVILLNMKEIPKGQTYTSHPLLSHENFISFLLIAKDIMLEFYLDSDTRF
jgi:hypothetical protein